MNASVSFVSYICSTDGILGPDCMFSANEVCFAIFILDYFIYDEAEPVTKIVVLATPDFPHLFN